MTEALDEAFRRHVSGHVPSGAPGHVPPSVDRSRLLRLFDAQTASRHIDVVARELQARGDGFYTIASAGHESNAAVAMALRPTDPALLHYRSGGFYVARALQVEGSTPVRDILQGLMGSVDEPIAGGRHKVFGHARLAIIPQTSTIASHLPRALGLAVGIERAHRLRVESPWPHDAVVVCSFGDASANHSTAAGAVNTALNTAYRGLPVPLLLVCEDNGLGISVRTPSGWIEQTYGQRPGLRYFHADGADAEQTLAVCDAAARYVRDERRPAFLHLRTVRYLGHAGSDAEVAYRLPTELTADLDRDPIIGTARALIDRGWSTTHELLGRYAAARTEVDHEVARLTGTRRLGGAAGVMAPLSPRTPDVVAADAASLQHGGGPERSATTLGDAIGRTLGDILEADPSAIVFGEDVGVKGGVYGVTRGLARRFGQSRVFDTLLDEQSILGLALGSSLAGLIPIPEIQYLAYLHNAEDQLRGEAASLSFFSQGQYRNPMVVRVAGLAYQRGFGGHFHNDNSVAVLRDIPGLVIACPSRADDAASMLRTCVASARVDGTVAVFLEPIALYHRRDLHEDGDDGWLAADTLHHVPIGSARRHRKGGDVTVVTFGNGVPMSLRAAARLADEGIEATVLDLRWLAPLPVDDLLAAAHDTGRVVVADETRHSGGVGEGIIAALVENGFRGPIERVAGKDSFIPLGTAAQHVLIGEDDVAQAARKVAHQPRTRPR